MTTTDDPARPTHPTRRPLYLGSLRADAVCNRHGAMIRRGPPVVGRGGDVFAAREGVSLYACPECCLDLFADAGEPTADPDGIVELLWKRYLDDGWNRSLRTLFVALGPGRLESRGGPSVVLSDDNIVSEAAIPEYLSGRVARLV